MNVDRQLLTDDEAARAAALNVSQSFIVQAPAGSGKTELLIQRYLRLLATVENPEEVLAITFTLKAAAEMRLRVVQALQAARRGDQPQEPYQVVTAEAAANVLERDRQLDWQLIANPGRMRIQTIDSLNASIARMRPLATSSGAGQTSIATDADVRVLYRRAAYLTLDQLAETGDYSHATEAVLRHLDNNTGLYCTYVAGMLATRDQWLPFVGSGRLSDGEAQQLRSRFEHNLEQSVMGKLQQLAGSMPPDHAATLLRFADFAARNLQELGKTDHIVTRLAGVRILAAESPSDISVWHALAELLLTRQGDWRKRVTVAQGFPPAHKETKEEFHTFLAKLAEAEAFRQQLHEARDLPQTKYNDEQWSILLALFQLLPLAVTELQRLFGERGVTDYTEVALSAAGAIGTADQPGDVALLLDYQLRHLLIDEMQDTASAQYRMLEALTGGWQEGDGRTLFCVGDPMQSIYRFRNAEVGQFLLAQQSGIGALSLAPLTLRQNFRSGEHLVAWFNDVFPGVLADKDDPTESAVKYEPAVAVPGLAGLGVCTVHPLFGNDQEQESRLGCEVIAETLAAYPDETVAVLVRTRTQLSKLLAKLRSAGIGYNAVEIDRLTDLPEIIDVLALTRALAHSGDRLAWLALLRSPFTGLDWTDLHSLVKGVPSSQTVWQLLRDDERLNELSEFGKNAVASFVAVIAPEMCANRIESLRDRVERVWLKLGGPAIPLDTAGIENVYRYLDVLERLEDGGTLADVARLEAALDHEHVSSEGSARLQIMTMHKAKGLQFDHVLLYGLGHAPAAHQRSVLSWFDVPGEHGTEEKILSPVGPRADIEQDPLHQFIEKIEKNKFRHELGRLLYVACTRAKRSLHLIGHVDLTGDESGLRPPRSNTLLQLLWPAVQGEFERAFANAEIGGDEAELAVWRQPVLRRFDVPWQSPEPLALPVATAAEAAPPEQEEVEFYWVGSEARTAGTLVHRWLQLFAEHDLPLTADSLQGVVPTSRKWLRGMGIGGEAAAEICERVFMAVQATIADQKGQWLLHGPGSTELALSGLYDDELVSVVLDRVRIDEDGTHWIVDYKTSAHEGGNLDAFLQAEVVRYSPQLLKYRQVYGNYAQVDARCALYFPLLQKFVPLEL